MARNPGDETISGLKNGRFTGRQDPSWAAAGVMSNVLEISAAGRAAVAKEGVARGIRSWVAAYVRAIAGQLDAK